MTRVIIIKVVFLLPVIKQLFSFNTTIFQINKNKNVQESCLLKILSNNFPEDYSLIFIQQNNSDIPTNLKNKYIVLNDKKTYENRDSNIENKNETHHNIFIFNSYNISLLNKVIVNLINSSFWHLRKSPRGKFIFLTNNAAMKDLKYLFIFLWKNDITKIAFINEKHTIKEQNIKNKQNKEMNKILKATSDVEIITANPYANENKCGTKAELISVKSCDNTNSSNLFHIPKKLKNCKLKAGVLHILYGPPLICDIKSYEKGFYIIPMEIIKKTLEFDVFYELVPDQLQYDYFKYGAKIRPLIYTKEREIMVANGNRIQYIYDEFDMTDIFYYDDQIWIYVIPDKISNIKILMSVFSFKVWAAILAVGFSVSVIWFVFAFFKDESVFKSFTKCFLDVYQLSFLVALNVIPKSFQLKIIFLTYLIFAFYANNFFQAKLHSILTKPDFEKGIDNVEDLVKSDKITPMTYILNMRALSTMEYPLAKKLYPRVSKLTDAIDNLLFEKVVKYKNISITTYAGILKYFRFTNKVKNIGSNFLLGVEANYSMRKGHPFLDSINVVINRMVRAGLQQAWITKMAKVNFEIDVASEVVLSFDHIRGVVYIWSVGLVAGFVVFLGEIFYYLIWNKFKTNVSMIS